jgi:hypothetical protein
MQISLFDLSNPLDRRRPITFQDYLPYNELCRDALDSLFNQQTLTIEFIIKWAHSNEELGKHLLMFYEDFLDESEKFVDTIDKELITQTEFLPPFIDIFQFAYWNNPQIFPRIENGYYSNFDKTEVQVVQEITSLFRKYHYLIQGK